MNIDAVNFGRRIPLFPLPNCVLFPGVVQPLHIFEPRYQEMMAAVLDDQGVIALGLLLPGWEKNYYGAPPVHETLCVGKVIAHERLDDGKYNLLLHGLTRARVLNEAKEGLYRTVKLEPVLESEPSAGPSHEGLQRKVLHDLFSKTPLKDLTVAQSLQALFEESVPTARLVDVLAFTLVQDIPTKQRLLEELDPVKRGEHLLRELVSIAQALGTQPKDPTPERRWPPPASAN